MGIWLGLKLTKTKETVVVKEVEVLVPVPASPSEPFVVNAARMRELGITPRELEILTQIAAGLSTREIAEKLFVSENTVKTHSSRLFDKLNAKRRTQAVQIAKDAGLIPERMIFGGEVGQRKITRSGDAEFDVSGLSSAEITPTRAGSAHT